MRTREADAIRKREARQKERDLVIPRCKHPKLRRDAEKDVEKWLRRYRGDDFTRDFTEQQREMIAAIINAANYGGDQAIAGPRGEGKSMLAETVTMFCILTGMLRFPVLFAATGPDAEQMLNNIKEQFEENDLLFDDYPEVCVPVRDLAGAPNRAQGQTVGGKRTRIRWTGRYIRFPMVARSKASGAVLATRGLDAAVRGIRFGSLRPDLAIIDDPDTADTAVSTDQAAKLEKKIDRDIGGLGGQSKTLARVILTTCATRRSISYKLTDRMAKPSFNGKRFKLLIKQPDNETLWEEYMSLRRVGMQGDDRFGRRAHQFYLEHREEMDAGALVGNPFRFSNKMLPDGSPMQVSALQFCYDFIADKSLDAFNTEYQNEPPEETEAKESGITPTRVQRQVSGFVQAVVPPGCVCLTQGIDVHKRALYWVVRAWRPDFSGFATGFTIDYGITEVLGTKPNVDEGVDEAIYQALHSRREWIEEHPYCTQDGRSITDQLTLVDSMWKRDAVFRFCDEAGLGWYPGVGYGRSDGCAMPNFREPVASNPNKIMGWQYFSAPRADGGWLIHINADHWKGWEHDRWMSDPAKPGALLLYGEPSRDPERLSPDQKGHLSYAHHICAEVEVEEPVKGRLKRYWKTKNHNNHYLDCSYRADVAAAMCGMRLFGMPFMEEYHAEEDSPMVTTPGGDAFCVLDRG